MKFCFKYYRGCPFYTDELSIIYDKENENVKDFITKHSNQTIIIDCRFFNGNLENSFDYFNFENVKIEISEAQSNYVNILKEKNIKWFFADFVETIEQLNKYIKMGVSDVYIVGDLGFHIIEISELCHKNSVNVRVYPNIAQTNNAEGADNLKTFFIRPEDLFLYENYIDVIEMWGPLNIQDTLFTIYGEGRWLGNLEDIIFNNNLNIDNKTIVPYFGSARVGCKKRCEDKRCDICGVVESFAKVLEEKGFGLKKEKTYFDKNKFTKEDMSNEPGTTIESDGEIS